MDAAADLGLFGPESVTWKVHREPIMFVAGLRSLYLQALHPRAMAGVAQNSSYRDDGWGRLMRTSTYVGTTIYGSTADAEAAGARLRRRHARLSAIDPQTGERFRIDEPDLLRWVHVAEVESFLTTARRAGLELTGAETDGYYAEQRRAAALVGLDPATVPGAAAEVDAYFEEIRPQLRMTPAAAEALLYLTVPPVPQSWGGLPMRLGLSLGPARMLYFGVAGTALGLLPAWARRLYGGLGWATTDATANLSVRGLRLLIKALPRHLRESPMRRDALARAAAAKPADPPTG
jgi:uncharacterized protein (DUF2236 family)